MGHADIRTPHSLSRGHGSRRDLVAMLVVAGLAVAVYANSLPNEFVYDDLPICLEDGRSRDLGQIKAMFTQGYWRMPDAGFDALQDRPRPVYRPITLLSFAINHALTGPNPAAYRLVNLLLHAGVSAAVYALCMLLFPRRIIGLVAGLVFAVHPIHTEAVASIVGRSELLVAVTTLLAVVLHIQDALKNRPGGLTWRYAATLTLFLIGLGSKESAITLAGLLVAADVWLKTQGWDWARTRSWRRYLLDRLWRRYVGVLAVVACFMGARWIVLGQLFGSADVIRTTENVLMDATPYERFCTCLLVLAKYVYLLFIPHPLSYDYSVRAVELQTTLFNGPVLAGLACVGAMMAAVVVSARRRREVAAAVIVFAITYSVASNVLIRISTLMAERLIYLPSVGVCMLWGLGASAAATRWPGPIRLPVWRNARLPIHTVVLVVVLGTLLGVYGTLTVLRNRIWRNARVLFETGVAIQPLSHKCWLNLGRHYLGRGNQRDGMACLEKALERAPRAHEVLTRLGWYYTTSGRLDRALALLTRAEQARPPTETFTLWLRAQLCKKTGNLDEAVRLYEATLAIKPDHQIALVNLATIHLEPESGRHHDLDKAYEYATRAARLPAPQPQAVATLALVCVKSGRRAQAARTIARGLRLLDAYRAKARPLGKLDELAPTYDRLEASLREMQQQIGSTPKTPTRTPRTGPAGTTRP